MWGLGRLMMRLYFLYELGDSYDVLLDALAAAAFDPPPGRHTSASPMTGRGQTCQGNKNF